MKDKFNFCITHNEKEDVDCLQFGFVTDNIFTMYQNGELTVNQARQIFGLKPLNDIEVVVLQGIKITGETF
jgi:hypothetical protein